MAFVNSQAFRRFGSLFGLAGTKTMRQVDDIIASPVVDMATMMRSALGERWLFAHEETQGGAAGNEVKELDVWDPSAWDLILRAGRTVTNAEGIPRAHDAWIESVGVIYDTTGGVTDSVICRFTGVGLTLGSARPLWWASTEAPLGTSFLLRDDAWIVPPPVGLSDELAQQMLFRTTVAANVTWQLALTVVSAPKGTFPSPNNF